MKMFEIDEFRRLLKELFDLKQRTEPYNYQEWFTSGANASQCKNILDAMSTQIAALVKSAKLDNGYSFKVDYSKGAGRFPRVPWIAILFNNEKPTNAVYPVIAFNKNNWYVACVESFKNPQGDFYEKFNRNRDVRLTSDDRRKLHETGLDQFCHVALMPSIFGKYEEMTETKFIDALKKAIDIYVEYKGNNKRTMRSQKKNWVIKVKVNDALAWIKAMVSLQSQKGEQWVFRGQSNSDWPLETSLGRIVEYSDITGHGVVGGEQLKSAETIAMAEFSCEASRDVQYRSLKGVDLLALMQHHGSKTRLLDFTYSPLSALFFAMDLGRASSFAVWAVRLGVFCKEGEGLAKHIENDLKEANRLLKLSENRECDTGVLIVRPKITNTRLSAQHGLFLMPKNLNFSFESNLQNSVPSVSYEKLSLSNLNKMNDVAVVKFVFSEKMKENVFSLLKAMQITPRSIFPDINGLAQSVTWDVSGNLKN